MAIRIRVYPQHNSIGARRNRARKRKNRQLNQQRQQLRLQQQQLIRQQQLMQQQAMGLQPGYSQVQGFGMGLNNGNAYYGGYSSVPTSLPPSYGFGNAWSGTAYLAPGVMGFTTGFGSSPFSVAQNAAFGLGRFF